MSIKGYPTQEKDERLSSQFVTVEPVREKQYALSVNSHMYVYVVGTDAVEASSTTSVVNATAHAAQVGDIIRFTSGALSGKEVKVSSISTNSITLAETLVSAPAAAVTFQILRHKYPVVAADGSLSVSTSAAPIQFVLDGVDTQVVEDTITPANNTPLPVKLTGVTGDINITAGDLNVQLSHAGASYDSTRIGDGTDLLAITAAGEAQVKVTSELPAGTQTIGSVNAIQSGTWNINNVSGTVSLPTGAATEAKQDTGNTSLSSIDGKTPSLGQALMASSVPVAIASNQSAIPASQSGTWNINNVSGTVSLPTGAATEAKQDTGNTSLSSIDGKIPSNLTVTSTRLLVDGSGVTQPVSGTVAASQSGTWNINNVSGTISLPTGAATEAKQDTGNSSLSSIDGKTPALGQALMAASSPVVIASNQSAIPASQSGTWNINNISGTVSLPTGAATESTLSTLEGKVPANLTVSSTRLLVDGSGVTQPVSGTVTADQGGAWTVTANQGGSWSVTAVATDLDIRNLVPSQDAVKISDGTDSLEITASGQAQVILSTALPSGTNNIGDVDVLTQPARSHTTDSIKIGDGTDILAISATGEASVLITSALPAGSNVIGAVTQSGTWSTRTQDGSGNSLTSEALGSNRALHVKQLGRTVVTTVRNDYTSTSVTTGAWVQLVASLSSEVQEIEIFDSSGQTLELGTGAAASEARLILVFPGGNGRVPVRIASGTRVSIRAVSATANAGELDINFYS